MTYRVAFNIPIRLAANLGLTPGCRYVSYGPINDEYIVMVENDNGDIVGLPMEYIF